MLSELGINVVEGEESEDPAEAGAEAEDGEKRSPAATSTMTSAAPTTPVRMYLREMGSVELVVARGRNRDLPSASRPAREMMIGGICESPLTVRAMVGWRDALNEK